MKKLFVIMLTALALGMSQQATAQKFVLIDMEYILKNIPAYERANEQLSQVSKQWQAEVDALTTEA
ncbi:MAG: OmpH family outer membrane protein, partial [Prevotella sp.]|nr:OmpH family outer membrane protein [Prevotella sp.]